MKAKIIISLIFILSVFSLNAQDNGNKTDSVETIKKFKNLFKYKNFYIGGQPTLEELKWLKSKGVTKIINMRTESENKEYKEYAYNEESHIKQIGFDYLAFPVNSSIDYTPEKLKAFSKLLKKKEQIFIHCRSGRRVTNFFVPYLIKYKNYDVNKAFEIGRNLKFSLPFEQLLDKKFSMELLSE